MLTPAAMPGAVSSLMPARDCAVRRWDGAREDDAVETVADETPVAIVYNGRPFVVMMATPQDLEDFVLGFSLSEGIVSDPAEVLDLRIAAVADGIEASATIAPARFLALEGMQRNLTGRTGCGLCGAQALSQAVRHPPAVGLARRMAPATLQSAIGALAGRQPINAQTGSLHAAAWIEEDGSVVLVREDVGRHNALDKLIGAVRRSGGATTGGAALITSRASYEMVQKAATVGIEILCAISAPTALAISLAQETGMTLVAYARSGRHTAYANAGRLQSHGERAAG
ncbi:MAG: formate dehydrogenase accessory sulfurtransferase FdhD [Gammaproteobacteria bacterium]